MNSRITKTLFQGIAIWVLLMLVITTTWYFAASFSIAPFENLRDPLSSENIDVYIGLNLICITLSFWIASLKNRFSSIKNELSRLQTSMQQVNQELDIAKLSNKHTLRDLPVAYAELDKSLNIIDCNHNMCGLLQTDRAQLIGLSFSDLITTGSQDDWQSKAVMLASPDSDKKFQTEMQSAALKKIGKTVWVRISKKIDFEDPQNPIIKLTLTDVSDLHFAENYMQEAYQLLEQQIINRTSDLYEINERMALAADSAGLGIWDLDMTSYDLIWDNWMYRLHGITESSFGGNLAFWESLVHKDDYQEVHHVWKEAIEHQKTFDVEFRINLPNGELRWLKNNAICRYDKLGKPTRMIGACRDITSQRENEHLIRQQADYDNLTGLPNRKLFYELLNQEIKQSRRDGFAIWILFLDLDGFKEVNDTLGHHVGDILLQKVAERLQSLMRNADIVARLGGDEFVIILTDIDETTYVDKICSKIIESIGKEYRINSEEVFVTASIGIANFPQDADNTADLLKYADQSMYVSKNEGKNRFSYFTPELQHASMLRKEVTTELRQGIAENNYRLYIQPIVNLKTGKVHKAEVLLRWIHPTKGMISPADFIPIAEETGVIKDIGHWIFKNTFELLSNWKHRIPDDFQLSINMSPVQLKSTDKNSDDWLDLIEQYGLKGSNIVIEITEGLLLKNDSVVNERLKRFSKAGVQVAIDDFGTGYSSLAYLQEFDIDYLKIDQCFIQKLDHGTSEESLSHAIIVMAHQLGLQIIAEGIETVEQENILKGMDGDFGQGYYYSKPIEPDSFAEKYLTNC